MAKKKVVKKKTEKSFVPQFEDALPQNIVPFGEHVEEDKNIYISQSAYKEIHRFTKDKTTNESGGVLLGKVIEEFGKTNIVIYAFIEAKYSEGTPTTLKFTHETWEYIHKEADKKYPDLKILGWIHTHPNFGIFLSEYDKFIQQNFFSEANQIAYVVDPIQQIEGFYFWINEKIERCKGFYVFDKTGTKITVNDEKEEPEETVATSSSLYTKVIIGVLSAVIVILVFVCISFSGRINALESQKKTLAASANQSLSYMQQQIAALQNEITNLTKATDSIDDEKTDEKEETEKKSGGEQTEDKQGQQEDVDSQSSTEKQESEESTSEVITDKGASSNE